MKEFLAQRLDASRDLYLLAWPSANAAPPVQQAHPGSPAALHLCDRGSARSGLDTLDIQNLLARQGIDLVDEMRPDLLERLDEMLRTHAYPR